MSDNKDNNSVSDECLLDSDGERVGSTKEGEKEKCKGAFEREDKGDDESKSAATSPTHPREVEDTTEYLLDTPLVDGTKLLEREVWANSREETKQEVQPYPEDTTFYDENTASNEPFDPEKGLDLETPRYDVERSDEIEKHMSDSDKGDGYYDIEKGVDLQVKGEDESEVASTSTRDDEEEDVGPSEEVLPGAVRILGIDGDPLADLAESDYEEETQGESTVVPEIEAELVDHEEEQRRMRESVTKLVHDQIIHNAPVAEVQQTKCSPRMKQWLILGGIAFVVIAIAVGVSMGVIIPRKQSSKSSKDTVTVEPTAAPTVQPLDELLSSVSFDGGKALRTPSTPQNMAYKWLANNTNLNTYTDQRKIQRYALATLYFGTNGTSWGENTNWLGDTHECGIWRGPDGVLECTLDEEVLELALGYNNLVGRLPPEIALLSNSLATLNLYDNEISGFIPTEIGYLTAMTLFALWGNQLSGSIPTEIGLLTNLDGLDLSNNQLTGSIPTEISHLTAMDLLLYLGRNKLSGTIPTEIGLLTAMASLYLTGNELSGSIPTEIGYLTTMTYYLELSTNQLTGTIPLFLHNMTKLNSLDLSKNQLRGTIPSFFHDMTMTNLYTLYLYDNDFRGSFTCPEFIRSCWISCDPEETDWDDQNGTCRSL